MACGKGSSFTRYGLAASIALALCLSGCGANTLSILMFTGAVYEAERGPSSAGEPELDASRRVHEQDCTKPVEDPSANLKCR